MPEYVRDAADDDTERNSRYFLALCRGRAALAAVSLAVAWAVTHYMDKERAAHQDDMLGKVTARKTSSSRPADDAPASRRADAGARSGRRRPQPAEHDGQ